MNEMEFFEALKSAEHVDDVEKAISLFEEEHGGRVTWLPVGGRENNRGIIEVSADPGRAATERVINMNDALLEAEFLRHGGHPTCSSPKEAAGAWLNVPNGGLSEMTESQRRALAKRATVRILPGDGRAARVVEFEDRGIGVRPEDMPNTILSLNASNKIQKKYLAGTYGQGGSSTFAVSRYTIMLTRHASGGPVGLTVVKFLDLPPEQYKTGHYVYLALDGAPLALDLALDRVPVGTLIRHVGYDFSDYTGTRGPRSAYGLLNRVLFDPVVPVWLEDHTHTIKIRRTIAGARTKLNGATEEAEEGDEEDGKVVYTAKMFYIDLGEFGRIGIEYWVLPPPTATNKRPLESYVTAPKPIILTIDGQNHGELPVSLVKKDSELPYLATRLICHIDCNSLTPHARRALFVSNREDARRGLVYEMIKDEIIRVLKSDDNLARLNNEARHSTMEEQDETTVQRMRQEVARLLRLHGVDIADHGGTTTARPGEEGTTIHPPRRPRRPPAPPRPIELHDPPTYVKLLWDENEPITFYPDQRRYLRIETDAPSSYHDPRDPSASRLNVIVMGTGVTRAGSTPLNGGRMRAILAAPHNAMVGDSGKIRIELSRPGLPTLSDERNYTIVPPPPARPANQPVTLPPFEIKPISPEDAMWTTLGLPDDATSVASIAVHENGMLVVYYNTSYPKYAAQRQKFESRDPALADSFERRYRIWLAVHSLLLQQAEADAGEEATEIDDEAREREERCRIATLASLFAAREVQMDAASAVSD